MNHLKGQKVAFQSFGGDTVAKPDLSSLTIDELTELIDEATSLRTAHYESRRRELQEELAELETRMGKGAPSGGVARSKSDISAVSRKSGATATHEGPAGETWAGRGGVPKWAARRRYVTSMGLPTGFRQRRG